MDAGAKKSMSFVMKVRSGARVVGLALSASLVFSSVGCSDEEAHTDFDKEEGRTEFHELDQERYETGDPAGIPSNPPHAQGVLEQRVPEDPEGRPALPPDLGMITEEKFPEFRGVYVMTAAKKLDALESRLRTWSEELNTAERVNLETRIGRLRQELQMLNQTQPDAWVPAQRRFDSELALLEERVYAATEAPVQEVTPGQRDEEAVG